MMQFCGFLLILSGALLVLYAKPCESMNGSDRLTNLHDKIPVESEKFYKSCFRCRSLA